MSVSHNCVLTHAYLSGLIRGSGAAFQFDGTTLASKGVVVVTFNYRLGALGFVALEVSIKKRET